MLKLKVRVVIDAIGRKREDDAGDNRGAGVAGEPADQQGDTEEAAILYTEAVSKKPDWEEAWFRLGYWQLQQQDYASSIEAFDNCVKLRPEWVDAQLNLAIAYWRKGDKTPARAALEKAHAAQPKSALILRALTALATELNDLDEAASYHAKLLQMGDKSPELSYNLGIALQSAMRLEDAAKAYSDALASDPEFAEANLNLGHVLNSLGKEDEARAYWDKALSKNPDLVQ